MPTKAQIEYLLKELEFTLTPEQEPILYDLSRVVLVAGGEQAGKSDTAAKKLLTRLTEGKLYWLVAADYGRTRAEYDYICDGLDKFHFPYTATRQVDPGEIITLDNIRIVTKSAKDPRRLAMEAPDGILGCEASQLTYEDFLRLRGRIAPKRGWLHLSGTFESSLGWYPEHFLRWQLPNQDDARAYSLPSWTNIHLYPGGRTDPEIKRLEAGCSADWFSERYGGIPVPPRGRVFPEFSNAIHVGTGEQFEFDPSLDVHLWVDPGYGHFYAVEVIQKRGEAIFVVDEIYERGLVTSDIITVCQGKPWWNKVVGGAVDVAALQHQAMPAVSEIWIREGKLHLRSQKVRIQDGIERLKTFLKVNPLTGQSGIHINTKCRGLISELGGCPNPEDGQTKVYKWKTDREGNIIGEVPEDRNCDAIKATVYGLVDLMGYSTAQRRQPETKYFK